MNQRKCSVAYHQQRIGDLLGAWQSNQTGFSVRVKQDGAENRPLRDTEGQWDGFWITSKCRDKLHSFRLLGSKFCCCCFQLRFDYCPLEVRGETPVVNDSLIICFSDGSKTPVHSYISVVGMESSSHDLGGVLFNRSRTNSWDTEGQPLNSPCSEFGVVHSYWISYFVP